MEFPLTIIALVTALGSPDRFFARRASDRPEQVSISPHITIKRRLKAFTLCSRFRVLKFARVFHNDEYINVSLVCTITLGSFIIIPIESLPTNWTLLIEKIAITTRAHNSTSTRDAIIRWSSATSSLLVVCSQLYLPRRPGPNTKKQ
jgi:hypothetical protein